MQAAEFKRTVSRFSGVTDEAERERMIDAFFETLGERITPDEAKDLGAQLPNGLSEKLKTRPGDEVKDYTAEEFVKIFALRHDRGRADAEKHAKAIWDALKEAVSGGEMDDVRAQLPDDYERIFGVVAQGALQR